MEELRILSWVKRPWHLRYWDAHWSLPREGPQGLSACGDYKKKKIYRAHYFHYLSSGLCSLRVCSDLQVWKWCVESLDDIGNNQWHRHQWQTVYPGLTVPRLDTTQTFPMFPVVQCHSTASAMIQWNLYSHHADSAWKTMSEHHRPPRGSVWQIITVAGGWWVSCQTKKTSSNLFRKVIVASCLLPVSVAVMFSIFSLASPFLNWYAFVHNVAGAVNEWCQLNPKTPNYTFKRCQTITET